MKHCSITDVSDQPTTANLLASQHLLKRYFDSTGECDLFEHAAIKLYHNEDEAIDPLKFDFGLNKTLNEENCTSYPIVYQRKRIGDLKLAGKSSNTGYLQQSTEHNATKVARKIALLVKRDQANTLSGLYLGKELSLEGYSETVFDLEAFIEKAAGTLSPVVIQGDFGSEKLAVASSIHYNSQLKHKPFIEIMCAKSPQQDFRHKLTNCFVKAKGGCIYLHGIDELSMEQQNLLVELLGASSEHSMTLWPQINTADVRILVSSSQCLQTLVQQNRFSRQLHSQISFLHVQLPSLNERREDLSAIIEQQVKRHRLYQEQNISPEVEQSLCKYHWPENYQELERTIARLLALSNNNPVNAEDLKLFAPQIFEHAQTAIKQPNSTTSKIESVLIPSLMEANFDPFNQLHPGLQKALKYLAENYCKEITLTELAQNAFVSPSHLSYLLKHFLGHSFKQILAELRIEQAKLMFDAAPNARITDVSLDVGFGDLSHFEKIFKRYTHVTPRQYKNGRKLQS